MKRIITNITGGLLLALCIVPTLLSVVSCGQQAADRDIAVADSLSEAAPQRAMTLIDSLEGESTMNKSRHMKLLLLKAKVRNKLAMPMSTDSLKDIADYFDKHGDSNERMLAYYILGCVYQRSQDAPMALQYFHEAATKADTTDSSCDFLTLHRTHVWSAEILKSQFAFSDAFHENSLAFKYAMKAKDTLNAIITYEQKSNIYNALGLSDSAIFIREKLYGLYSKYGYEKEAVRSLGLLINYGVENKELSDVKHYINLYEHKSGNFNDKGDIKKGVEIYYVTKGRYLAEINELDSAEYYFRKCARTAKNYSDLKYCFDDLADIYRKRNRPDSVAKYADLARMMTDSAYAQMSTEHLQQMQAMYNYNRYRQTAEEAEKDALRTKYISIIIIMAIMAAAIGGALAVRTYIMRKRRARVDEIKEYKRKINELETSRAELESINSGLNAEVNRMIEEKTKKIDILKTEYEKNFNNVKDKDLFECEPIVIQIRWKARKTTKPMDKDEISRLKELFKDYRPLSNWENTLNNNEYLICLLVRLDFVPAEICILTDLSSSNISNIRKRLLEKMTGREGSPKDFDKYIKSL
jgi:tetratricopeptide (TPR) repeat protein